MLNASRPDEIVFSDRLARWERGISAHADRIADGLRRWKYVVLFVFSTLYFLSTCFHASRKLFWYDELVSLYISRLPDMASIWSALKQGVDLNPPLFYWITRFSESLIGEGHVGARLPEILGFWICCLCLFRFVSSRTSVLAGTISMLFPLVTTAYLFAYEARPHGIVLGCGGVALVCWQAVSRSRRRRRIWWLIGLYAALLCALLNHAYAVLLFVPLALAEFTRSLLLRRVDWSVWLAMVASSLGMLPSLFRLKQSNGGLQAFNPAHLKTLANAYQFHLAPAAGVLAAALVLYFVFTFASPDPPAAPRGERSLELPEVVALLAFVAMPVFLYLLSKLMGAPLFNRYAISTVIGFGCLFGIVTAKRPPVGLGVLLLLVAQIAIYHAKYAQSDSFSEPTTGIVLSTRADEFAHRYQLMEAVPDKKSPIVLLDDLEFLPTLYYAPPDIMSRLVYVAPDSDTNYRGYITLERVCNAPGQVETLSKFFSTHDTFLAYGNYRTYYRLENMIEKGADLKVEHVTAENVLVSVTLKKDRGEPPATTPR